MGPKKPGFWNYLKWAMASIFAPATIANKVGEIWDQQEKFLDTPQLFHRITDAESAQVRRAISESPWVEKVRFRNIDLSEEALKDLREGTQAEQIPALFHGGHWYLGAAQIEEWLKEHKV